MQGTLNQPYIALFSIYVGIILAGVYLLLRMLTHKWAKKAAARYIVDGVYVLVVAAAIIFFVATASNFVLRAYYFLGVFIGASIYLFGIRPILRLVKKLFISKRRKKL